MLQLKNTTPFAANMALFPDEEGVDALYVNVKATFTIGPQWTLADEQLPPQAEDEYYGEPGSSSLKYSSDYHLGKPATDIIMLGHACAPDQTPVQQLDVSLSVANLAKTIRVFGDREWQNGSITAPASFKTMPLVYERAFGGTHVADNEGEKTVGEARNPVGVGFSGRRKPREMDGQPLPNLEDPRQLIQSVRDNPEPACFGYRSPNWQPRVSYAGTYDQQWQAERAPYLPFDYDKRFLSAAHPDLICDGFLQGGEAVEIVNMHPTGELRFDLPYIKLVAHVDFDVGSISPAFNLETVLLEPNQLQIAMVWKAKVPCDKKTLKIKQVTVALSR